MHWQLHEPLDDVDGCVDGDAHLASVARRRAVMPPSALLRRTTSGRTPTIALRTPASLYRCAACAAAAPSAEVAAAVAGAACAAGTTVCAGAWKPRYTRPSSIIADAIAGVGASGHQGRERTWKVGAPCVPHMGGRHLMDLLSRELLNHHLHATCATLLVANLCYSN